MAMRWLCMFVAVSAFLVALIRSPNSSVLPTRKNNEASVAKSFSKWGTPGLVPVTPEPEGL